MTLRYFQSLVAPYRGSIIWTMEKIVQYPNL